MFSSIATHITRCGFPSSRGNGKKTGTGAGVQKGLLSENTNHGPWCAPTGAEAGTFPFFPPAGFTPHPGRSSLTESRRALGRGDILFSKSGTHAGKEPGAEASGVTQGSLPRDSSPGEQRRGERRGGRKKSVPRAPAGRGHTLPLSERTREGILIVKPQKAAYLCQAEGRIPQIFPREEPPLPGDNFMKRGACRAQHALKGAPSHAHFRCHLIEARAAAREMALNHPADLGKKGFAPAARVGVAGKEIEQLFVVVRERSVRILAREGDDVQGAEQVTGQP